jgi:hypothetical protein
VGQEAGRVLSNPTGGAEQSKRAAQQLADANSAVPNAIQGGAQKVGRICLCLCQRWNVALVRYAARQPS